MKKLELNQMENLEGGFSWKQCAGGAVSLGWAYGNSGLAVMGGLWGLAGAAAVGCAIGGMA